MAEVDRSSNVKGVTVLKSSRTPSTKGTASSRIFNGEEHVESYL